MSTCAVSALFALQADAQAGAMAKEVVRDLCERQVVLLGESPTHGFGRTMKFKAELIRGLVDSCGFTAVFFESGIYDFLNIRHGHRGVLAGHQKSLRRDA